MGEQTEMVCQACHGDGWQLVQIHAEGCDEGEGCVEGCPVAFQEQCQYCMGTGRITP